ncbi:transmembrane protein, putative (macronuclear) [Tetrahymena thermophila SB210]|uniref:Transmembrane protein, putative n=1 Tax=Tetrahymena thermophila (strain SB210) TaxID=312017 RepID=Q234V9_TETTS|nr:transmembrane protein, putative [Tetrahymena thermophila SB210]EAR91894.2 transmembrane protein, putative [Tetrahymena thermophila SB210]|eukprot:XP_001012139.2 transmembrane protein, putative [Tetrahymena thermophila SB210]
METVCHVPQIVKSVIKLGVQSVFLISSFIKMDNVGYVQKMEYTMIQIKMLAYNVTKVAQLVMVIYLITVCLVTPTLTFKTTILVNVMKVMDILFKVSIVQNAIKVARLVVVVYLITVCLVTPTLIFNMMELALAVIQTMDILFWAPNVQNVIKVARLVMVIYLITVCLVTPTLVINRMELVTVIQAKDILFKISIVQNVIKVARLVMEVLAQAAQLAILVCIYMKIIHVNLAINKWGITFKDKVVQNVIKIAQLAMKTLKNVQVVLLINTCKKIIHANLAINKWGITFKDKVVQNVIKIAQLAMKTLKNVQVVLLINTCKKIILVQLLVIQAKGFLFKIINVQRVMQVVQHVLVVQFKNAQLVVQTNFFKFNQLNYFLKRNQISTGGSCQPCDKSCAKCKGPSNKDCLACSKNYILLPSIGKCALCEEGYFFNQNNCEQCNEMCTTCFGKNQNECIDCRGGLTLSSITKTCQSSSQIENENNLLEYSKIVGCYNQTDQQVVSSCLDQIERSKSSTQNLDTLAVINLSLIVASSVFTPIGSSLAWNIMDELTRNENELRSSSIYLYSKYLYSTSQKRRKTLLVQSIQHSILYQ